MPAATYNSAQDVRWYDKDGDELATALGLVFTVVRDENEWRTDKDEYHWGLYEGTGVGGITTRSRRGYTYENATLPDNLVKMSIDTLTAKVATIRPIPQVFASRGNWKDQRRARKLRQFIEGEFYRQKIHEELSARIIKDALISRAGVVQVYANGKKPCVERVHPWTLYTDDWDAEYNAPMTMMRLRTMDRNKAIAQYGKTSKLKDKIAQASRFSASLRLAHDEERASTVSRVELVEAWYRCTEHDDEDHKCTGKHVIICENAVLFDEEWPHDYFPFAILTYDSPNTGLWGTGLAQTLEGYQVSINNSNSHLNEMYELSGKYIILRDGSGVFNYDIQNNLRILHCKPGPYDPTVFDADFVNEHLRMRPLELVQRGLNASGISQMSAQAQKPAGIEAGIALQTLDDIESQRHVVFGRRFEAWCMNVARLLVDVMKEIADEYGDYSVDVPLKGTYLPLNWKDVHVDGFQLQMQSVGALFLSFTGRLDKLKTLFDAGLIDGPTFMRYLDAGDIQAELDLETVHQTIVDEMIESMLDSDGNDSDYLAPYGDLPLKWAFKRAHQRKLQAQMDGAPQEVLDLMTRFIDDLQYLMDRASGGAPGQAPPIGPPANPPPPPGGPNMGPMPPLPGGLPPVPPPAGLPGPILPPPPMGVAA